MTQKVIRKSYIEKLQKEVTQTINPLEDSIDPYSKETSYYHPSIEFIGRLLTPPLPEKGGLTCW